MKKVSVKKVCMVLGLAFLITMFSYCLAPWAGAQLVLKAGHNTAADYPHARILLHFADKVGEYSQGKLKIQVYHNETLGHERALFEGLRLGTVDIAKTISSVPGNWVTELGIFDLPYLFKDLDHQLSVLNGPIGKDLSQKLEDSGVKILWWGEQGTRNFYTSKVQINRVSDMKGLKIRVMESPIMVDTINALGAAATPMPYGEIYTSIKQGIIDGAENAPDALYVSKQYEVAKYYALTEHFRTPVIFMMSMITWKKLTPENQGYILKAAADASEWGKTLYSKEAAEYLKKLKDAGEIVTTPNTEEFRQAVEPVYAKYGAKFGLDRIKSIRGK